ncbi:amino acid ABC transporter permease [Candidatus Haliotispira prima]|uniref:Amino acid ABC transporter permease n=1 Tax=Candidatus Haliotispira prima TaxID=3034016 RepID=A0ABY8ML37_9SPIO|nr:amino acid ABC transporter permease [Candidatus Haliotispira prima]
MAQIDLENKKLRIQVNDGALIPAKGDRSGLVSWHLTFWGALAVIAILVIWKPEPYLRILDFLPDGILVTFQVTVLSIIFATMIGLLAGLGQVVHSAWINRITVIYIEVIRGIPLLVQLFYIYYALGRFLNVQGMVAAVIAMAVCYGAYMGEIFRAGIQSIPKGQMEAAIALGMTRRQAIRKVILPQTVRITLPAIGNEFIALLKDSSLVSVLAISDLLRRGREFASTSFLYFETYTMVALVYLVFTLFLSRLVGLMEDRMNKGNEG